MSPPSATTGSPDEYRLPLDVKPTHYDVTVRTDLDKLTFDGFVKIDLDVKKDTSTLVFNSSELELGEASLYSEAHQKTYIQTSQSENKVSERVTLKFSGTLPAGSKAKLEIGFSGKLTGSMAGYYKSSYEHDGKTKYYALTQFEPTAFRKMIPGWDEPLLKATFAVTMISRADTTNLSNMSAISEEIYKPDSKQHKGDQKLENLLSSLALDESTSEGKGQWKITKFETTPPMSTYIVAFANGHFEYLESSYTSPISGKTRPLRIYATADHIHQAQFALDVKAKSLPIYEQVFDVEYPLPKLDTLIASDFDAGAMENWGLITGRTSAFLLDPKNADMSAKKQVASTQLHEVAHMWFGNITTMEWWNYLYLNEGFATLMGEVIIMDKMFPEWKSDSEFITGHLNSALTLDAKLSSHPIEVECPDANHINQIFDALSYSKAASVLRMLSDYVGEEKFLKGVSIYLKKRLFKNSVTTDLWDGIQESTGIEVAKIMENWISKIGFPVLSVTETPEGIRVRQDRFLSSGAAEAKDNETIWTVPLSILSTDKDGKTKIDKTAVLDKREKTFAIDTSKPFKLNAGTVGVYHVLYTPERLTKLAAEAAKDDSAFTFGDRIGLVYDTMSLARAGFAKVSDALTLIQTLRNEKEFLVWDGLSTNLGALVSTWWEHPEVVKNMDLFSQALYRPLVERLGFEYSDTDSADTSQLRTRAITDAAEANDELVVNELKKRFAHFMKTGEDSQIPADLQKITFRTAVKHGGVEEYNAMVKIFEKPKTPTINIAAIRALGATQNPDLIEETMRRISKARDQDVLYFFAGLLANFKTRRRLANYLKDEYDVLYKRFEGNFTLQILIKYSFAALSTEKDYQEIQEFFKDKDTNKYHQALAQTLEGIKTKTSLIERSTTDVTRWLENWKKEAKL